MLFVNFMAMASPLTPATTKPLPLLKGVFIGYIFGETSPTLSNAALHVKLQKVQHKIMGCTLLSQSQKTYGKIFRWILFLVFPEQPDMLTLFLLLWTVSLKWHIFFLASVLV
ncbi:hypothetical protein PanWU01x14_145210, partial [Parasponia andersonii]